VCVCVCVCRGNILETQNASYLKSCIYSSDSHVDRLCPVFRLSDVVLEAQSDADNSSYDSIAVYVCVTPRADRCLYRLCSQLCTKSCAKFGVNPFTGTSTVNRLNTSPDDCYMLMEEILGRF